jgi:hypothetical protein
LENTEEKSEKISKIWKKGKLIVKRYAKYGPNPRSIAIRFGKYRRKLWNEIENMEERQV